MRSSIFLFSFLFTSTLCLNLAKVSFVAEKDIQNIGLEYGSPMLQQVTNGFNYVNGMWWNNDEEALVFVDSKDSTFNMYYPAAGKTYSIVFNPTWGKHLVSAIPVKNKNDQYILTGDQSMYLITIIGKKETMVYTFKPIMHVVKENGMIVSETRTDKNSNLLFGTRAQEFKIDITPPIAINEDINFKYEKEYPKDKAALYYARVSTDVKSIDKPFDKVSGICFDKTYSKLFVGDGLKNIIYEYKYDPNNGSISDKKVIFAVKDFSLHGNISALVMDNQDRLYIGLKNSTTLLVYNVFTRNIINKIRVPTTMVSSLAFGSKDLDILFVGTAKYSPYSKYLSQHETGDIWALSGTGATGYIQPRLAVPDNILSQLLH